MDAFSKKLVDMVRSAPDEVILDLVRAQLVGGTLNVDMGSKAPAPTAGPAPKGPRELDDAVRDVVVGSTGLSAGEVATAVRCDKARASAALKRLARRGAIQRAGERRFTRYASDVKTAKAASLRARGKA